MILWYLGQLVLDLTHIKQRETAFCKVHFGAGIRSGWHSVIRSKTGVIVAYNKVVEHHMWLPWKVSVCLFVALHIKVGSWPM